MILEPVWNNERLRWEVELTDQMIDYFDLPYEAIHEEITGEHRWSVSKTGIFFDGDGSEEGDSNPYRIWWESPATEMQDLDDHWQRHGRTAVLQELKTKTVTYYGDVEQ